MVYSIQVKVGGGGGGATGVNKWDDPNNYALTRTSEQLIMTQ